MFCVSHYKYVFLFLGSQGRLCELKCMCSSNNDPRVFFSGNDSEAGR